MIEPSRYQGQERPIVRLMYLPAARGAEMRNDGLTLTILPLKPHFSRRERPRSLPAP